MMICSRTSTCVDKTNDAECLSELPATETTTAGKLEPEYNTGIRKRKQ